MKCYFAIENLGTGKLCSIIDNQCENDISYFINVCETKENFVKIATSLVVNDVITPDGVWHTKDNLSKKEALEWMLLFIKNFIETADPEWTITIIDYHF